MKNPKTRHRGRALSAAIAVTTATLLSVGGAPAPVRAEVPPLVITAVTSLVPGAGTVVSYIRYAKDAYGLFLQYASKLLPEKISDLAKLQAAIAQSTAAITEHSDALVNGMVRACVDDATVALGGFETKSPDTQMAAAAAAIACVHLAKNEIPVEGLAGVDTLGFALNTVGPIALFMQNYIGQPTNVLQQNIILANQTLIDRLQPTCGVTPDVDVHDAINDYNSSDWDLGDHIPGLLEHAPIPGHGACYNYTAPAPTTVSNGVVIFPTGVGTGADPWTVIGDGAPEYCLAIFWCGSHVNWPPVADHSIAVDQAMANTSYPVAKAALHRLLPSIGGTFGPREAVTSSTAYPGKNVAFSIDSGGQLLTSTYTVGQTPVWTAVADAPELQSVAAASNSDGRVEVFGVNRRGEILHSWQLAPSEFTWIGAGWAQMDGQANSIKMNLQQDGALRILATNQSGAMYSRSQVFGADRHSRWQVAPPLPAVNYWNGWIGVSPLSISQLPDLSTRLGIELEANDIYVTGGVSPRIVSISGLPPGMLYDTSGRISGAPTVVGVFPGSYVVTDATGTTTPTKYFTFTVTQAVVRDFTGTGTGSKATTAMSSAMSKAQQKATAAGFAASECRETDSSTDMDEFGTWTASYTIRCVK